MTSLILTTYNRPAYLSECLTSLQAVQFPQDSLLIIVDDASQDLETLRLINEFELPNTTIVKHFKPFNKGIKDSLQIGFSLAWHYGSDIAINLDGDAIVKPNFITELLRLHNNNKAHIISGFNCDNPKNPVISSGSTHVIRKHCNGINMLVTKELYDKYIRLNTSGNWDFDSTPDNGVVIAKPSLVQHIGVNSSMGHVGGDVACDYYDLELPTVTLFGIDAHDPEGLKRAAEISQKHIKFGAVEIITDHDYFRGREGYSEFIIKRLNEFVETDHVLIIHSDGYPVNYKAWDNKFLEYDYGGATWWYKDNMNVGNGGFSLRSKKLLEICAKLEDDNFHPEDSYLCRTIRTWLEKEHDVKFMPEEMANRFSIEAYGTIDQSYNGAFGFHGFHVKGVPYPPQRKQINSPIPVQRQNRSRLLRNRR